MSEEAVWTSDINFLALAVQSHEALLRSIFGGGDNAPARRRRPSERPEGRLTPTLFDKLFGRSKKRG